MKKDKTNRIRINENAIRKIVENSLRRMMYEQDMHGGMQGGEQRPAGTGNGEILYNGGIAFYPVENAMEYAKANGLTQKPMYKVGKVQARPSVAGQNNAGTNLEGGFMERGSYVEKGNTMIVRNPKGEEYEVPMEEFNRKYTLDQSTPADANGYRTYNAFDKRMISSPIKHNLYKEMPNWGPGQKQFGRAGDAHFVNMESSDSYFIGDAELKSTHVANPNGGAQMNEAKLSRMIKKMVKESLRRIMKEDKPDWADDPEERHAHEMDRIYHTNYFSSSLKDPSVTPWSKKVKRDW